MLTLSSDKNSNKLLIVIPVVTILTQIVTLSNILDCDCDNSLAKLASSISRGSEAVTPAPRTMADAEALRALLRSIARERGYADDDISITPITSGGANYTSELFLATISSPAMPHLRLFAKVACIGEKMRDRVNADALFKTEQIFYTKLVKAWESFAVKYKVPEKHRFVFPKYYGGNPEKRKETIVLENLVAAGYGSFNRFKSIDWENGSKAVEVLAKYHALSYVYAREDPVEYDELVNELKFQMKHDDDPSVKIIWAKMMDSAMAVIDERFKHRVKRYFTSCDERELFEKYHRPTRAPVLVHGDYRPSNLLFRKQVSVFAVCDKV